MTLLLDIQVKQTSQGLDFDLLEVQKKYKERYSEIPDNIKLLKAMERKDLRIEENKIIINKKNFVLDGGYSVIYWDFPQIIGDGIWFRKNLIVVDESFNFYTDFNFSKLDGCHDSIFESNQFIVKGSKLYNELVSLDIEKPYTNLTKIPFINSSYALSM